MIKIKDVFFEYTEDFDDFEDSQFDSEIYFVLNITLLLGDEDASSFFYFDLTNDYVPSLDKKVLENIDVYFRRKGLFVIKSFDKITLMNFLQKFIANKDVNSLTKYFNWEFDNYVP